MKSLMTLTGLAVLMAVGLTTTTVDAAERGPRLKSEANRQLNGQRTGRELRAAGDIQRNTNVTLRDGRQASREHTRAIDRESGTWSASTVTTDAQSRVGTRNVNGSVDPETGSFQREINSSNRNGQSTSTTITGQRTENGVVRDRTTTLGDGRTATAHTEVVHENGVRTVTTTGQNLEGEAFSRTATSAHTESGLVRDVTASGPNGERSRHDEVVRDANTGTITRTSNGVNAAGEWNASAVTTRNEDSFVRDASRTTANGTVSQHGELIRNGDGSWTRSQTTTHADGSSRTVTVNGTVDAQTGARNRDVSVTRTPPPAASKPIP